MAEDECSCEDILRKPQAAIFTAFFVTFALYRLRGGESEHILPGIQDNANDPGDQQHSMHKEGDQHQEGAAPPILFQFPDQECLCPDAIAWAKSTIATKSATVRTSNRNRICITAHLMKCL